MDRSLCSVGARNGLRQRSADVALHCARSLAVRRSCSALSVRVRLTRRCTSGPMPTAGSCIRTSRPPGDVKVGHAHRAAAARQSQCGEGIGGEGGREPRSSSSTPRKPRRRSAQLRVDADKRRLPARIRAPKSPAWRRIRSSLYRYNEKGEQVYMDDAERRKRRETLENCVRNNNCPRSAEDGASVTKRRPARSPFASAPGVGGADQAAHLRVTSSRDWPG